MKQNVSEKGQSLIELMIAVGLMGLLIPAFFAGFFATRSGRPQQDQRQQAILLAREAAEAVRIVRDNDWKSFIALADGTTSYCPIQVGGTWALTTTCPVINGFTRGSVLSPVNRDVSGNITSSGGTSDPSTIKVVTTVSWSAKVPSNIVNIQYLTRNTNLTYTETTQAQFNAGVTKNNITITNISGGEIILGPGVSNGDWCAPSLAISPFTLPGNGKTTTAINTSAVYSSNAVHVYSTSGGNQSGDSMDGVTITDPASPASPAASLTQQYINQKTYGVFVDTSNSRAYLTSDHPNLTVDIVNLATNKQILTYADSGGEAGNSVYVSGTTGFVTAGNFLYAFDTTTGKELGKSPKLSGTAGKVIVIGANAYIADSDTKKQLQIVNISNLKNMTITTANLGNGAGAVDLSLDSGGTTVYLVTSYVSSTIPDFFVYDLGTKTITHSYNTNGMNPSGVAFVPGGRGIVVGTGGEQYQVWDTTKSTTTPCGGLTNPNSATSVNSVSYLAEPDGDVFSYIITSDSSNNHKLQIIQGGPGGSAKYATTGTFESQTFDAGHASAFNNFSVTQTTNPPTTTISYLIAIKSGNNGSCSGVAFSNSDFAAGPYTSGGSLPLATGASGYVNPGQCLRYRAILSTTDTNQTPTLYDITFNYSP